MKTESKKLVEKNIKGIFKLSRRIAESDMKRTDKREALRLLGILRRTYQQSNGYQVLVEMTMEQYRDYIENR